MSLASDHGTSRIVAFEVFTTYITSIDIHEQYTLSLRKVNTPHFTKHRLSHPAKNHSPLYSCHQRLHQRPPEQILRYTGVPSDLRRLQRCPGVCLPVHSSFKSREKVGQDGELSIMLGDEGRLAHWAMADTWIISASILRTRHFGGPFVTLLRSSAQMWVTYVKAIWVLKSIYPSFSETRGEKLCSVETRQPLPNKEPLEWFTRKGQKLFKKTQQKARSRWSGLVTKDICCENIAMDHGGLFFTQVLGSKWRCEGLLDPMLAIVVSHMASTFAFFKGPSFDVARCNYSDNTKLLLKGNL